MPGRPVTTGQIAAFVQGTLFGPPDRPISGVRGLQEAGSGDLSFLAAESATPVITATGAGALLVHQRLANVACPQIVVKNPALAMAQVTQEFFVHKRPASGVSNLAHLGAGVALGADISIWPFVTLDDGVSIGRGTTLYSGVFVGEGSRIGEDCLIYPNVTIREGVTIGHRVIIHSGTVVGSDGFGYLQEGGRHHKIPQIGTVVIEDDVELGANVTVDRATFGQTIVRRGTKVDNLVQIAHNVEIGEHNILVAQVGIAGSSKTGHHVMVGGQAGIADHVTVGDQVMIGARSALNRDVPAKQIVSGAPAMPHKEWLRLMALIPTLPAFRERLRTLEARLNKLEKASLKPLKSPKRRRRR